MKIIREEKIKKKSALFKYDRILRLTSEPRLIYFKTDKSYKGDIPIEQGMKIELLDST